MKMKSSILFVLLLTLLGPASAETTTENCQLIGAKEGLTEECHALRQAFRAEVSACMKLMQDEASSRKGEVFQVNAQTSRARFLICDAEARSRMGLASF